MLALWFECWFTGHAGEVRRRWLVHAARARRPKLCRQLKRPPISTRRDGGLNDWDGVPSRNQLGQGLSGLRDPGLDSPSCPSWTLGRKRSGHQFSPEARTQRISGEASRSVG